ncbi:rhodanese-like domain-containing protein [Paracoccus sediminilitoris]|uniref:rhodanese-like domain-containing protein n=1 Tax=Paracoccus sediminilitoris TaxID=2202419 RepID=UPI001F40DA4C|nr:rhodanese-like domain-containing protein [Paracoccus sediminilitoris]
MIKSLLSASALALIAGAASAADGPLVTNEWLETKLDAPSIALIEVSVNPGVFKRGHIPFATNLAWHTNLVDPVRSDIASREHLEGLLSEAGVNEDSTVVLYGDTNN